MTPLQMAEVAATVANGGKLMEPRLWSKVTDPDGRVTTAQPRAPEPGDERGHRSQARRDDDRRRQEGTGTAAALSGINVAGQDGNRRDRPGGGINQAWFIGFAPADDPRSRSP